MCSKILVEMWQPVRPTGTRDLVYVSFLSWELLILHGCEKQRDFIDGFCDGEDSILSE